MYRIALNNNMTTQERLNKITALVAKQEEKTIVFGLTGTGYFDMFAYARYNDGEMTDYIPSDEEIKKSIEKLPKL